MYVVATCLICTGCFTKFGILVLYSLVFLDTIFSIHPIQIDHVLFCGRQNADGKRLDHKQRRLLKMSMGILKKSAGINGLKDLINEPLMPQAFHVPASRG